MTNPAAITPQHTSARRCCTLKNDAESESLTPASTLKRPGIGDCSFS